MNPDELVPTADTMAMVRNALRLVGILANLNGRRLARAYAESKMTLYLPDPLNKARFARMAPRSIRRQVVRDLRARAKKANPQINRFDVREAFPFRPVIGHNIPAPGHKDVIAALKQAAFFDEGTLGRDLAKIRLEPTKEV